MKKATAPGVRVPRPGLRRSCGVQTGGPQAMPPVVAFLPRVTPASNRSRPVVWLYAAADPTDTRMPRNATGRMSGIGHAEGVQDVVVISINWNTSSRFRPRRNVSAITRTLEGQPLSGNGFNAAFI
jgi:hypothetical protein